MSQISLSFCLGLIATTAILTPISAKAATFDYNQLQLISTRPIESNQVLSFLGNQSDNQGFVAFANLNPTAPDAGHTGGRELNAGTTSYYQAGRQASLINSGATRSVSLNNFTGFSNFLNALNSQNIPLSSIGISYGQKAGQDFRKTWNLGEDKLGQDWFMTRKGLVEIEELIYRANPDEVEVFLSYGTTRIVDFSYSPSYVVSTNDNNGTLVFGRNILLFDPVKALKTPGLDPVSSVLADTFLQDVNAGGGSVQFYSDAVVDPVDVLFNIDQGYKVLTISLPLELRVVSVPEPSSILGFLALGTIGVISCLNQLKKSQ